MSMQSRPAASASPTPVGPRYTASTCDDDGSIVTTMSLRFATSAAASSADVAPSFTAACSAVGTAS